MRSGSFGRTSSADQDGDVVLLPGDGVVLAELKGPGIIDRIFVAIEGSDTFWRDILIRITWDGAAGPSVQAPIGDFFAVGPGARQELQSIPFAVQSAGRSFTSLWKMPFAQSAKVELVNEGIHETRQLVWEVDYRSQVTLADDSLYFHAQYTQASPPEPGRPLTAMRASGTGQYVGMSVISQNGEPGNWANGAVRFHIDGVNDKGPGAVSILNYFGNIFGLSKVSGPYQGCTLQEGNREKARHSVYRFHIHDPVPFEQSIEVLVDHGPENERTDRMAAVTYWYQSVPAVPFDKIASARNRRWDAPSDEEIALWKRADELNSEVLGAYRAKDLEKARVLLEELVQLEPTSVYAAYNLACLYSLHGEKDRALHMLQQAIELGFTELSFARHDPDLQGLHDSERFRVLVGLDVRSQKTGQE